MKSRTVKSVRAKRPLFPVVAIGASAGGLEAYTELFRALPPDLGMAFVLIQHLDPSHPSLLTEILAKATKMPVEEVKEGARIKPNRVYVIPPDNFMAIAEGAFVLTPRSKEHGQHLSINFFMRSLAEARKGGAIGVVLSGTGGDGTLGAEAIKAEGGLNFAQSPESAKYDGMPRSAIASGCVDFVLTPKEIAEELERIHRHPYVRTAALASEPGADAASETSLQAPHSLEKNDFSKMLDLLRKGTGTDFSQYKPNTLQRRAWRRMMILKLDSMGEYVRHLKEHPEEVQSLYDDVLIPVTSFFRDFEAFEYLKSDVYPAIVDKSSKGTVRMWAPGCSTGEETYSLAMTLLEYLGERASSFQIQIFGTDLSERGVQKARTGLYGEGIADEISPERLKRFFVKVDEGYRINKAVRDLCVFARQNLAHDPPFSQMNLVACRNLLIYLQPSLQKKIIPILHYALKPNGFLVLGSSESVTGFPNLFSALDKRHKIFVKKPIASRLHYDFTATHYPAGSGMDTGTATGTKAATPPDDIEAEIEIRADRAVLRSYAPVGVVINSALEVVQFRGRTTPYLEPPPGKPSLNVLKMARGELSLELRGLIAAAKRKHATARKNGVYFEGHGHDSHPSRTERAKNGAPRVQAPRIINLSVVPLGVDESHLAHPSRKERVENGAHRDDDYFLVLFEEAPAPTAPEQDGQRAGKAAPENGREVKRLRQELAEFQDALRAATESEDAAKEEFQSANEEILSANEELQSTNEELETSKEELQSANEELSTLNEELNHKNTDLHVLNNDLHNLLSSISVPVVMLDRGSRIRRFTANANQIMQAVPADVGRSIGDLRLNLRVTDLDATISRVLETLQPIKREVQDLHDRWQSLTVLPYRTTEDKIDGVVLVLQDIDAVKRANEQLKRSTEFLRGIVDTVRDPLLVLDAELRIIAANQPFYQAFQVSPQETADSFLYRISNEQWNIPRLRKLLQQVLEKDEIVTDFEVEHDFEKLGRRTMLLNARRLAQTHSPELMLLLVIEDVTARKAAEARAAELHQQLRQQALISDTTLSSIVDYAYSFDREGRFLYANRPLLDSWGRKLEEVVGKNFFDLGHPPELAALLQQQIEQVFVEGKMVEGETWYINPQGRNGFYEYVLSPVFGPEGKVEQVVGSTHELTERKLSEAALIKSEKLAAAGQLAASLAHEINNPLQAVTNLMSLLTGSAQMDEQGQRYTAMAENELKRVVHLVRQSLGFYREQQAPAAVNVEELLDGILLLYTRRLSYKNIEVKKEYLLDGAGFRGYADALRQVFSTLLVNAMDSMERGGEIAVRASASLDWHDGDGEAKRRGLRLTVCDSGHGIPAQDLRRVFEPFFTTKGDQGTGLGLWVAQGIVSKIGGSLRVRSREQKGTSGTCFSVFFPEAGD